MTQQQGAWQWCHSNKGRTSELRLLPVLATLITLTFSLRLSPLEWTPARGCVRVCEGVGMWIWVCEGVGVWVCGYGCVCGCAYVCVCGCACVCVCMCIWACVDVM